MNRVLSLSFVLLALAGCYSPATITLKDGQRIETKDTPRMNRDGFYEYQELDGSEARVNGVEVLKIEEK